MPEYKRRLMLLKRLVFHISKRRVKFINENIRYMVCVEKDILKTVCEYKYLNLLMIYYF